MLSPWKKSYDKPRQCIKKQRYHFADKSPYSQSYGFSSSHVQMYGSESWTVKKAERWRIDVFELWFWRRLFRVLWTARRSNQSILKEINPEYSLEGLMLKLQYFGHLMWRADSLEKNPNAGKDWGQEDKGATEDEMTRWHPRLNGHELEQTLGDSEGQGCLACCSPWGHKNGTWPSDWTTITADRHYVIWQISLKYIHLA